MHVVMVVPGGVDRGGEERVIPALLSLIEGLAARHQVTVVALGQEPVASRYPLLGATVHNVAPEQRGPHRLARLAGRAVMAAGRDGRPDVIWGMWASVSGLVAVLAGRRYRVPSAVHVAGGELVAMADIGYGGGLGRGGRIISSFTLHRADAVTTASHWMARHVRQHGHRVDQIIPLGVDTDRFVPPPSVRRSTSPFQLVCLADLNPVKDHATLLAALDELRRLRPELRFELDLIGTDTLHGAVQQRAAERGLVVRAHGFLPSSQLPALLQRADLHVMSARHDAGPVAALEAAACGLATVGTDVGHLADWARADPPAALTVPPRRADLLGPAIGEVLSDGARRSALAAAARAFAKRHDRHATVDAFDELFTRLRRTR
ncbi:MAG: glycosyltransferase family 4 protein [Acidimicrobiales bacterium]